MKLFLIFASFLIVQVKSGKIHPTSSASYKAGVVEFNVRTYITGQEKIDENTKRVIDIINSDETKNVEILVFPEAILNDATVPIPLLKSFEGHSLCDLPNVHWMLRNISCAVKKRQFYVVINLVTKYDSGAIYNTALVLDRKGSIAAKYRKYHLFGEAGVQSPPRPDVITFKTDFGVTFGIFICFDILFEEPAITLVNRGIKNFIYPTMWISELPYLTAVQIQQGWAYANNVNLLAANANRLETSTFGSGIYTGKGGNSIAFVATKPTTKVIIADVPIDPSPFDETHEGSSVEPFDAGTDTEYNLWQENLSDYTIKFLNTSGVQSGEIQSNGVRCKYEVLITDLGENKNEKTYYYAVASVNGYRSYAGDTTTRTAQKICSVIACTKFNDRDSCGLRHKASSKVYKRFLFDRLDLSTDLQISNMRIIPNTLAMNLKPLQKFNLTNSTTGNVYRINMKLQEPAMDILTFSIYARDYQNDIFPMDSQLKHATPSEKSNQKSRSKGCCCFP